MSTGTDRLVLLGVCTVTAVLRLWDLDLMEFKGDEAGVIDLALPLALGREWPLKGLVSSVGIHNPPLFIYLVAIPTAILPDPRFVTGALVGLSHVAATAITFLWVRRHMGFVTATAAALMFATAPWAVLYGRKLWAQDVLPPLVITSVYLCERFWRKRRSRAAFALPIILCALFQLHLSAVAVFALVGGMLAVGLRRIHYGALAAGTLLALLTLTPYLVHQAQRDYHDLRGFHNLAQGKRANGKPRSREKVWSAEPLVLSTQVVTDHSLAYAAGRSHRMFQASQSNAGSMLSKAAEAASQVLWVVGLGLLAARLTRRQTRTPAYIALGCWMFGYVAAMLVLRLEEQYPHYFIMLYPVAFVVMALPLGAACDRPDRKMGALAVTALTVVLVGNLTTLGAFRAFILAEGGTRGDYGAAFHHKLEMSQWLVAQGLRLDRARYELHHLVRITDAFGDQEAIDRVLAARGRAPTGSDRVRVVSTLRRPSAAGRKCRGRQDFGPLVACPRKPK
ncbi:MAG: hypothetical protein OXU20_08885 [Myxococcales bacterium]|nr:hypothetical protein [Myxococcales bacterium]MDD9969376.1 hypothetical protein [Myxococcales bacterium]